MPVFSHIWPGGPSVSLRVLLIIFHHPSLSACFLTWQDVPGVPCALPAPAVGLTVSRLQCPLPFVGNGAFRNQVLGTRCVHCCWGSTARGSRGGQSTGSVHGDTRTFVPVFSCLFACLSTYSLLWHIQSYSNTTGFILVFFLSISVTLLSDDERDPSFLILNIFTYLGVLRVRNHSSITTPHRPAWKPSPCSGCNPLSRQPPLQTPPSPGALTPCALRPPRPLSV